MISHLEPFSGSSKSAPKDVVQQLFQQIMIPMVSQAKRSLEDRRDGPRTAPRGRQEGLAYLAPLLPRYVASTSAVADMRGSATGYLRYQNAEQLRENGWLCCRSDAAAHGPLNGGPSAYAPGGACLEDTSRRPPAVCAARRRRGREERRSKHTTNAQAGGQGRRDETTSELPGQPEPP